MQEKSNDRETFSEYEERWSEEMLFERCEFCYGNQSPIIRIDNMVSFE